MCCSFELMNQRKYLVYAVLIIFLLTGMYFIAQKFYNFKSTDTSSVVIDYEEPTDSLPKASAYGKDLFMSKCASCHSIFKDMTGPALSEVVERGPWKDSSKLYNYIRNPESIINNKYIDTLRMKFGSHHLGFPDLTDAEIKAILNHIRFENRRPVYEVID